MRFSSKLLELNRPVTLFVIVVKRGRFVVDVCRFRTECGGHSRGGVEELRSIRGVPVVVVCTSHTMIDQKIARLLSLLLILLFSFSLASPPAARADEIKRVQAKVSPERYSFVDILRNALIKFTFD